MYGVQCPLEPHAFGKWILPMRLGHVKMIEYHISTGRCHHPPVREFICHGEIAGTTPLLLACRYGNLASVKHILEVWGVDVQASAVYYYESIKIDAATPLFVAASNGYVDIVRYLLEKGASFATKTVCASHSKYDGLTPLIGAFYTPADVTIKEPPLILRLLLEAGADPNTLPSWLKFTRDSEVATLLINHGLDLTVRHPTYPLTILEHWITILPGFATEEQSLSVVKLLVDKGADPVARGYVGFSPILWSAVRLKLSIFDHILKRDGIPRMDQINALELVGAVILGDSKYASLRPKAFEYWRRALQLRQLENEEGGPLIKTPLKFENVKTVEWVSADELEDVIQDPSKHLVHAFLLELRIAKSCELAVDRFLSPLSGNHLLLNQPVRFAYNLDVLWATMETIRRDTSGRLSDRAHSTTEALVKMLSFIQKDHLLLLTVEAVKISLELISDTDDYYMAGSKGETSADYTYALLQFIVLLARRPQILEENIKPGDHKGGTVRDVLRKLVQRDRRDEHENTLLNLACQLFYGWRAIDAPFDTIRLLLDCGADPNVCDVDGYSPLHSLALFEGKAVDSAANLLLEKGAHFDRVNKSGETAVDVWMKYQEGANGWKDRPSWCRPSAPPSLMCQCARVIRVNRVPYTVEPFTLPVNLQKFVELH